MAQNPQPRYEVTTLDPSTDELRTVAFDWSEHVIQLLVRNPLHWKIIRNAPRISVTAINQGVRYRQIGKKTKQAHRDDFTREWIKKPREKTTSVKMTSKTWPPGAFEAKYRDDDLFIRYLGTPAVPPRPHLGDLREHKHVIRLVPHPDDWALYTDPAAIIGTGPERAGLAPPIDPASPPPDFETMTRCAWCTFVPARGTQGDQPSCGIEGHSYDPFVPYDPLPTSQVHGAPDPDYVAPETPWSVEDATDEMVYGSRPRRTDDERARAIDEAPISDVHVPRGGPHYWEHIAREARDHPGEWITVDDPNYMTYTTRINRGRVPALRGLAARTRKYRLQVMAPRLVDDQAESDTKTDDTERITS